MLLPSWVFVARVKYCKKRENYRYSSQQEIQYGNENEHSDVPERFIMELPDNQYGSQRQQKGNGRSKECILVAQERKYAQYGYTGEGSHQYVAISSYNTHGTLQQQ